MSTALVVITDGRGDYLAQTLASAEEMLKGEFSPAIIVDDAGDTEYATWLDARFPSFWHRHHDHRSGFGAAVRTAWAAALEDPAVEFIFHLEEDFTFNEVLDTDAMAEILTDRGNVAQLVLKRQPWSGEEIAAGGQIEVSELQGSVMTEHDGIVMHTRNFSTNPCLFPRRVAELCIEAGIDFSEPEISRVLLEHGYVFAYLGTKTDPPRCHHIGANRSAGWRQ